MMKWRIYLLGITHSCLASIPLLLCMASQVHGQLTLPLSRDPVFDALPAFDIVERVFARWSVPFIGHLSLAPLVRFRPFLSGRPRRQRDPRLLGLNVGDIVRNTVGGLLRGVVSDPLFGGNVVKATGEKGDTEWYGSLAFGTPPQSIKVNFDTGSSDLFLYAPTCSTCILSNHTAFNPSRSATYRNLTTPWSIAFGDASQASGYVSSDTVRVSASPSQNPLAQSSSLDVQDFLLALATTMSASFAASTPSGLVGLAQDRLCGVEGGATLFSRLVRGGGLQQNVLGIRLVKGVRRDGVVGPGAGEYAFGKVMEQWVLGGQLGLTWVTVTSSNYWGIPFTDVQLGLASVLPPTTPQRAIIDTGTTLILTSAALATSIHSRIPDAYLSRSKVWIVPCDPASTTENLFFLIGGNRFGIPATDLAWKKADQEGYWCISGVQAGVEDFTVLGSMFIKNNYAALRYNDDGTLSVGLGLRTDVKPIL